MTTQDQFPKGNTLRPISTLATAQRDSHFAGAVYLLSCKKKNISWIEVMLLATFSDPQKWRLGQDAVLQFSLTVKESSETTVSTTKYSIQILEQETSRRQLFTIEADLSLLTEGKYVLTLQLLAPDGSPLPSDENHYCTVGYEVSASNQRWINALPSLLSLVSVKSTEWTLPTILSIKGTVRNLGHRSWRRKPGLGSVKLGGILSNKSNNEIHVVSEYRYEMPNEVTLPGESFDFIIIVSITGFDAGSYELSLDMVKEGDFWFMQHFGQTPSLLNFEVREKLPLTSSAVSPYLPSRVNAWKAPRTKIIWVCPNLPEFDQSTGGKRLFTILELQRQLGFDIVFLYEYESARSTIYKNALSALHIPAYINPLGYLMEHPQPENVLIIIGWYPCGARNLSAIRSLQPNNKVVLDSVDIHWMRSQRASLQGLASVSSAEIEKDKSDEIQVYKSVDEVWVVSNADQKELLFEIPSCPTRIIPVPLSERQDFPRVNLSLTAPEILFVGGFHHPPNASAAIWAAHICRALRAELNIHPVLHIIGADPPPEVLDLHDGSSVIVHGFVEDISTFYRKATAALVPLKFGAGVKGKLIEALSYGIPVISSSIGVEGLDMGGHLDRLVGDSTEALAANLLWAIQNPRDASIIARNAYTHLEATIGKERLKQSLLDATVYPSVTIVIVTYNKLSLLKKCLETLFQYTIHPNFRVAVWSNGCTDGTVEYLKDLRSRYPRILDIHLNADNDYFVKPNNELIRIYESDDIVLINNDIEFIDSSWLLALADAAYSSSAVACAGGLTVTPEGKVLEAGARILPNGFGINEFKGSAPENPEVRKFRYVGYSSGCFLYLKREALNKIGALDEQYHPMYFEDCDWQYRAHLLGLKTIYTPFAQAIHREGSSAGTDTSIGMKRFQELNRTKFIQRFSGVIEDLQY